MAETVTPSPSQVPNKFAQGCALVVVGGIALGAILVMCSPSDKATSTGAMTAQQKTDDIAAVAAVHRKLLDIDRQFDEATRAYRQASKTASGRNDLQGLYDAAVAYHGLLDVLGTEAFQLSPVGVANANAKESVSKAIEGERDRISSLSSAADSLAKAADSGEFRPSAVAAVRNAMDLAQQADMLEALEITKAYVDLGVPANRVDFNHGGVTTAGAPGTLDNPQEAPAK